MTIFVGLDCGGSTCRALANDSEGNVLFQGQSGAANLATTPTERLKANLRRATASCPPPEYVCGCFAGLLTPDDRLRATGLLRDLFPRTSKVRAEPDYVAALYASEGAEICVVAGTGSLVCSTSRGIVAKSGGRGYLLGDEGSAFQYGRDALKRFLAEPALASEGLRDSIETLFESTDESQIVARLYRTPSRAGLLAKLAKPLAADAAAGEPYAIESLRRNSEELAKVAVRHAKCHRPDQESLRIALTGGLWSASNQFVRAFQAAMENESQPNRVVILVVKRPPVYGAVALAKEMSLEH